MIKIIKNLLLQFISDIDSGNSNITEEEQLKIIDFINEINRKELTKTESANYIGVSRATFDNYIKKGKIPEGTKRQGSSNLYWNKNDLNKYLENEHKRSS